MFDISLLWQTNYLFKANPGGEFILGYGLLLFFLALFFLPGFLRSLSQNNKYLKKSMKKRLGIYRVLSVFGLILVASRFSEVPYFSMRIWLLLLVLLSVFFLVRNGWLIQKDYRKRLQSVERETS